MGYVFDLLILLTLFYTTYRILSRSFKENLLALLGLFLAMASAVFAFRILLAVHAVFAMNVLCKSAALCGLPLLSFSLMWKLFLRYAQPSLLHWFDDGLSNRGTRWKNRLANAVLLLAVLLVYAFSLDLMLQLSQFAPQGDLLFRQSTMLRLGRHIQTVLFLQETPEHDTKDELSSSFKPRTGRILIAASLLKEQKTALHALRKNLRDARAFLAEKSGSRKLIEYMKMTKTLAELSDDEKIWLFEVTPELQEIAGNASIKAIVRDEELLTMIMDASHGSLSALYALSRHEAMQVLFTDRELSELLRQVHLPELLRKLCERRERRELSDSIELSDNFWPSYSGITNAPSE